MTNQPRVRKKTPAELADHRQRRQSLRQQEIRTAAHAACDRLPKKRTEFILDIAAFAWVRRVDPDLSEQEFDQESRRWDRRRSQFLREATNPLELHLFASNWNCDAGAKPIHQIVTSPHCDAGTALWLYWENDPVFYQSFRHIRSADNEETRAWVRISRRIERRFQHDDFASAKIPFDPQPWVPDPPPSFSWIVRQIPDQMYQAVGPRPRRKHK